MTLAACNGAAQSADVRLGLHVEGSGSAIVNGYSPVFIPGVNLALVTPLSERLAFRAKVSAEYWRGPMVRLDTSLLSRGTVYLGAGVGTGYYFDSSDPWTVFSPLALANVHALVGKNFGPAQVEGHVRVSPLFSAGLSVNYLFPSR